MAIRKVATFVTSVSVAAALLVTLPGSGGGKVAAATKTAAHFQTTSDGIGERFLAGPFAAGTQLAISSFTVIAPNQFSPASVVLRVAHGTGSACSDFFRCAGAFVRERVAGDHNSFGVSRTAYVNRCYGELVPVARDRCVHDYNPRRCEQLIASRRAWL
jgi:hypothetical protein